jgi:hypothetical protein
MEFNMEHRKYEEILYLFSAGEADEEQKRIINEHLLSCNSCREELKYYYRLNEQLTPLASAGVSDDLLLKARTKLRERISVEHKRKSLFSRISDTVSFFFNDNYKYVLNGALSAAAGIIIGFFVFKGENVQPVFAPDSGTEISTASSVYPDETSGIRNIRLIDADPSDDHIEFSFEAVRQVNVSGNINDEKIRSVLMYAMMNGNNPGVRLNSLNLLKTSDNVDYDSEVKEAIISAVKYDDNPGVRREAMKVLKTIPFDQDVKRSYLYVILNDSSSALRIDAINQLLEVSSKGADLNKEDRDLFKDKLLDDENSYIRLRAKTILEEYN